MGKIKNCFESFGLLSGIKMILIEIQCRLWSGTSNKVVGIHSKRTGKNKIYFRKNTSDYDLIKTILMNVGEYDFLILDQVDFLSQVKVIVDAGANIGLFSRICRKLNSSAKIIAIEPEESNFDLLTKNLEPRGGQYSFEKWIMESFCKFGHRRRKCG